MSNKRDILVILGNGFDLAYGLKSSYKDFYESDFWPFKPKNIGTTKIRSVSELDRYLNRMMPTSEHWYDLESLLAKYASDITDVSAERAKEDLECFKELKKGLLEFISHAQGSVRKPTPMNPAVRAIWALHEFRVPKIYTFNYTDLSALASLGGVQGVVCYHVHGALEKRNIVIGIEDNIKVPKEYDFLKKVSEPTYRSSNLYYDLNNAKEVVFFGHSLGENDYHFFRHFFQIHSDEANSDTKHKCGITIFTANVKSRMDLLGNLRAMNDGRNNQLFAQNDLRFIRTKDDDTNSQLEFDEWIKFLENTKDKFKMNINPW